MFEEEDGHTLEKEILALTKELGLDRQISEGVKHLEDMLLKIQGDLSRPEQPSNNSCIGNADVDVSCTRICRHHCSVSTNKCQHVE